MNYEKMSRAMRYHYGCERQGRKGHLAMVKEKRLYYKLVEFFNPIIQGVSLSATPTPNLLFRGRQLIKHPVLFLAYIMAQLFKWHDLNTYIQLVDCRVCLMKIQFVDSHFFQVWGVGSKLERRGGCSYEASVQPASALQKPNLSLDKRIAGEPL